MYAPVHAYYPAFGPPPPPPPRRATNDSVEVSSPQESRAASPAETGPASTGRNSVHHQPSSKQHKGGSQCSKACSCCKQLSQLEGRVSKVETETQASLKSIAADVAKLRKERETAWKHVSELQEQNRLMRQRQRDLEEQNNLLNRLLQEKMERATENIVVPSRYSSEPAMLRPPLVALQLNQPSVVMSMPKVPHMGTEIW
ncbi:hypothetical protein Agub_g14582 [Astrephomene gubernaculifera]|uniref:Uncharacterized protein n=1 Tax=Astrephomene gubernaculifera TaxID=47775 RepID=A0AAD3E1P0_9CHLO|nr:hypothetical protein Agub_g14582 [Astrephomene gubernaculifera]